MNTLRLLRSLRTAALACFAAVSALGTAHAGLVTGNWDPQFGAYLPGLSWQVRAEVLVPDACSNQADGVYSTAIGACDNSNPATFKFLAVWLRLFDTAIANPNNFFGITANSSFFSWCDPSKFADPNCYMKFIAEMSA